MYSLCCYFIWIYWQSITKYRFIIVFGEERISLGTCKFFCGVEYDVLEIKFLCWRARLNCFLKINGQFKLIPLPPTPSEMHSRMVNWFTLTSIIASDNAPQASHSNRSTRICCLIARLYLFSCRWFYFTAVTNKKNITTLIKHFNYCYQKFYNQMDWTNQQETYI